VVRALFGGYLRNAVECLGCGAVSLAYDSFFTLEVAVPMQAARLEELLQRLVGRERLTGTEQYRCSR
jgi:ubiquitin C-terminal hydrolase